MQSIILTGAAGGIGKAATRMMIQAGYVVYAGAIDEWELAELNKLKTELKTEHLIPVYLDLREDNHIEEVVSRVEQESSQLAAVVTNGATSPIGVPFEHLDLEFVNEVYSINIFGNLKLIKRCLPLLKESKGRVVHVSSLFGKTAGAMMLGYSSSKHAGEAIMTILRRELKVYGIKVIITNPGMIWDTYMLAYQHEGAKNLVAKMKNCSPEEVSSQNFDVGKNTNVVQPALTPDTTYMGDYLGLMETAAKGLAPNKLCSSPENCAQSIMKAIQADKPKVRYINGLDARLLLALTWLLPETWMDKIATMIAVKK